MLTFFTALIVISAVVSTVSSTKCATQGNSKRGEWSVTASTTGLAKPCELIFKDDFLEFNLETWSHEITATGGGNKEFQIYTNNRSISYVKEGKLFIKPTLTANVFGEGFLTGGTLDLNDGAPATRCTNSREGGCYRVGNPNEIIPPVMSARIRTVNSFAFKYGTVVVRAKLPLGDWLFPAIWLLPQSNFYGGWPASGEMDIMESRGNLKLTTTNGVEAGVEQFASTLQFGPHWPLNGFQKAHLEYNTKADKGLHKDFHDYEMDWRPDGFTFKIDNIVVGNITPPKGGFWELGEFHKMNVDNPWKNANNLRMAPFDQKFHILINLAVGGTQGYFPDSTSSPQRPWKNGLSQGQASLEFWNAKDQWYPTWNSSEFVIDFVKVYASELVDKIASQKLPHSMKSPKGKSTAALFLPTNDCNEYFKYLMIFMISWFRFIQL